MRRKSSACFRAPWHLKASSTAHGGFGCLYGRPNYSDVYVGCELTISSSSTPSLSSSSTGTAFESKILLLIYDGTCSDEAPNEAGYLVGSGAPEAKPVRCVVGVAISIQCMASQLAAPRARASRRPGLRRSEQLPVPPAGPEPARRAGTGRAGTGRASGRAARTP